MIKYRPLLHASARINIGAMVKLATDDTVVAVLDGEIVVVHPGQTNVMAIEQDWHHAKGIREGWYIRMHKAQVILAAQMVALLDLDFTDFSAVIDWLEIVISIEQQFVFMPSDSIIQIFTLYGFETNVSPAAAEDDREGAARYIIGCALANKLQVDRSAFGPLINGWRKRFEPANSY